MCGIVGVTGSDPALPFLLEGLSRLEYRGYDSSGVALVDARPGLGAPAGGQAGRARPARSATRPARRSPASATPAGPPTAARPSATPTPTPTAPAPWPSSTTGSSRTTPSWATSWSSAGHELRSETDTEVLAHLIEAGMADRAPAWPTRCAAALRRVEGNFAIAVVHADDARPHRGRPPRRRRWSAGRTDGSRLRRLRHPRHPRPRPARSTSSTTTSVVEVRPGHPAGHDARRRRGRPRSAARSTGDLEAAEKGGYPDFMLKEIHEQPRGRPGDAARAGRQAATGCTLDEMRALRRGPARRRQGVHRRLRHQLPRRHGGPVRHRALGPPADARSTWPASSATATRCSTPRAWSSGVSQSGESARHHGGVPASPSGHQQGQGAGRLQRGRLVDGPRGRRRAVHPGRARERRGRHQDPPGPDRGHAGAGALPGPGAGHAATPSEVARQLEALARRCRR